MADGTGGIPISSNPDRGACRGDPNNAEIANEDLRSEVGGNQSGSEFVLLPFPLPLPFALP